MAQSNSSASGRQGGIRGFLSNNGNRTGNRITRGLDRANVVPGMDERGNFSWQEFRNDIGRTAANMAFPGLGTLLGLGLNNGWGLRGIGGAVSGTAGAIGRLFDGNPNTGFWNYGAAPWNMSPDGSPDFMGPPSNLAGSGSSPSAGGSFGGGGGGSSGFGPSSSGPSGGWNSPTGSWINTHGNNGNPQWGLGWLNNTNPSPSYSGPAPGSAGYGVIAPGGGGGGEGGSGDGGVSSGGNRGMTGGSNYGGQGWDPRTLHWILRGR